MLFDRAPAKASDAEPALRFFYWAFLNGDRLVAGTGFAPLPKKVQAKLSNRFATVKAQDGSPLKYLML